MSKVAVTGWVKTADEQGFDALMAKQRSGRPPKLSAEQCAAIDKAIQSAPEDFGFKVWDAKSSSYLYAELLASSFLSGSASACSMTWGIPVSAHSHTRARGMRTLTYGKALKKTSRNRRR